MRTPQYNQELMSEYRKIVSYRPNKSYETSKFSMMVTYNAIDYEELVAKLELKEKFRSKNRKC